MECHAVSQPTTKPKKRAYENLSDKSTQDWESVIKSESPTRSKAASDGTDEMDKVDQEKPTQSDCMSIDYIPYTAEDPQERAGTTPVLPEGKTSGWIKRVEASRTLYRRRSIAGCCAG